MIEADRESVACDEYEATSHATSLDSRRFPVLFFFFFSFLLLSSFVDAESFPVSVAKFTSSIE